MWTIINSKFELITYFVDLYYRFQSCLISRISSSKRYPFQVVLQPWSEKLNFQTCAIELSCNQIKTYANQLSGKLLVWSDGKWKLAWGKRSAPATNINFEVLPSQLSCFVRDSKIQSFSSWKKKKRLFLNSAFHYNELGCLEIDRNWVKPHFLEGSFQLLRQTLKLFSYWLCINLEDFRTKIIVRRASFQQWPATVLNQTLGLPH